jgi:hypothetical protein
MDSSFELLVPATARLQFHVLDGVDGRPKGDPLQYAVSVFNVLP